MKIPRWGQVLIAIAIIAVFLGIGAIVAVTAWFQQNLNVAETTERDAQVEFERVRQQFSGQPALIEVKNGTPYYAGGGPPAVTSEQKLSSMNVLAWEPEDQQLTRFSLPFWILRLQSEPIRLKSYVAGLDEGGVDLRPEDIEKFGPRIIVDTTTPDGERVLIWTQ